MTRFRMLALCLTTGALLTPAMARAQDTKPADATAKADAQAKEAEAAYKAATALAKEARSKAEAEVKVAMDRAKEAQALAETKAKEARNQVVEALRSVEEARKKSVAAQSQNRRVAVTRSTPASGWRLAAPDALEANFGLKLAAIDDALRAQLEIPKGQGVVVLESKPGALADQAGLKANDVIILVANDPIKGVNEARDILLKLGKAPVQVNLIRAGKPRQINIVGPEHGVVDMPVSYWIGVPVAPVDATLRSHLTSLPADTGLIATDVVAKSPAETAGVKKNDILISLGGTPLKVRESLTAAVQASEGKPVALEVIRAGKPVTITVTPEKRPAAQAASFTLPGQDNSFVVYRSVDPKLGIVTEARASVETAKPEDANAKKPFTLDFNIDFDQDNAADLIISDETRKALADVIAGTYKDPKVKSDEAIQDALKALQASVDALRKQVEEMAKPEKK